MSFEVVEPKVFPYFDYRRYSFSLAVRKGDYVFTSGQSASEFDSSLRKMVCKGGLKDQARTIHEKIRLVLDSAGIDFNDVVKIVDYVVPAVMGQEAVIDKVRAEYFDSNFPAISRVYVEGLVRSDALLEVECIASTRRSQSFEYVENKLKGVYPLAVRRGSIMFTSLAAPQMTSSSAVGRAGLRSQAKRAYGNLEATLQNLGAGLGDVVKVTEHVKPWCLKYVGEIVDTREQFFHDEFPAVTQIAADQLSQKGAFIELEAIVVLNGSKKTVADIDTVKHQNRASSRAVRKGGLIFVSAMPARKDVGEWRIGGGSIAAQIEQIYGNMGRVLDSVGAGLHNVVKTVDYLLSDGLEGYRDTADVRRKVFNGKFPASSGVLVKGLPTQNALIQVESIAVAD